MVVSLDIHAADFAEEYMSKLDSLGGRPGTIVVPHGTPGYLTHPIWHDADSVRVRGPGSSQSRITAMPGMPAMIISRRRAHWNRNRRDAAGLAYMSHKDAAGNYTLTDDFAADHRFDLYGFADKTLAPVPNQRFGVTTHSPSSGSPYPDHFIAWWDVPPATGLNDLWKGVHQVTIAVLVRPHGGGVDLRGTPFLGSGDISSPSPICVINGDDGFHCSFYCEGDQNLPMPWVPRSFRCGKTKGLVGGRTLLILQIDLLNARVHAWQDKKEVAIIPEWGVPGGPGPTLVAGSSFQQSVDSVFKLGGRGPTMTQWGDQDPLGDRGDHDFGGLCLSATALYASDADGNQVFDPGGPYAKLPVDDYHVLEGVDWDSTLIGHLYTFTPPTPGYRGREVLFITGPKTAHVAAMGFFLYGLGDVTDPTISNLKMSGVTFATGATTSNAVTLGQVLYADFEDVWFMGGTVGLAGWRGAPDYDIFLRRCGWFGLNAGVLLTSVILFVENVQRFDIGRVGISVAGSSTTIRNYPGGSTAAPDPLVTEAMVEFRAGAYGSIGNVDNMGPDNEGLPGPAFGLVHAYRHDTEMTWIVLSNLSPAVMSPGVAMVTLEDLLPPDPKARAICRVSNLLPNGAYPAVRAAKTWTVQADDSFDQAINPILQF